MTSVSKYTKAKNLVLKAGAYALLGAGDLNDPGLAVSRMNTCKECPFFDPNNVKCKDCGCFLEVKTKLLKNLNPDKGFRTELTHCPQGKWDDKQVANIYREMDGKPLLN